MANTQQGEYGENPIQEWEQKFNAMSLDERDYLMDTIGLHGPILQTWAGPTSAEDRWIKMAVIADLATRLQGRITP